MRIVANNTNWHTFSRSNDQTDHIDESSPWEQPSIWQVEFQYFADAIMSRDHRQTYNVTEKGSLISIGRYTYGIENMAISHANPGASLTVGSFCSIAQRTEVFLGGEHRVDWTTTFPFGHVFFDEFGKGTVGGHPTTKGDVVIGHDVWIGSGATILSGVTVGDGAVLAANANVIHDVAPYEIVGGNPAKHIKFRFEASVVEALMVLRWWDLPVDVIRQIAPALSQAPTAELISDLCKRYRP
jgi:acetyltransferase-like isoleucine patch superfamily enzyme